MQMPKFSISPFGIAGQRTDFSKWSFDDRLFLPAAPLQPYLEHYFVTRRFGPLADAPDLKVIPSIKPVLSFRVYSSRGLESGDRDHAVDRNILFLSGGGT